MSAFMHSVRHYAAVALAFAEGIIPIPQESCPVVTPGGVALHLRELLIIDPIYAVNLLAEENMLSVKYRYAHLHERVYLMPVRAKDLEQAPRLTKAEGIMALASVCHQSCEHPGWRDRGWADAFAKLVPEGYVDPAERPGINAWSL